MLEGEGIFVDLKNLKRVLKRAQFMMEKADRIIYGTPALENCKKALIAFEMAYDFMDEREHYARELKARVTVLRLDVEDIFEENVLKGCDPKTNRTADSIKREMVELLGRIDEGISRYVGSIFKGKNVRV